MFTKEQCTGITLEYAKNPSSLTIVKREFASKYDMCGRKKSKYCPHHFTRVFERFKSRGIAPATPQAKQLINQEIQENPTSSMRQIARKLHFSNAITRKILRKELKVKPFKFRRCQDHKQQRLVYCYWICNRNSSQPCPRTPCPSASWPFLNLKFEGYNQHLCGPNVDL